MAAALPSQANELAFGIEIECYLHPKETSDMNGLIADARWLRDKPGGRGYHRTKMYQVLQAVLRAKNVQAVLGEDREFGHRVIDGDATLRGEGDGFLGVELISPILFSRKNWQEEISRLFRHIATGFDIKVDGDYGTHVHVSPGADKHQPWTAPQIAAMLKAASVFDDSIVAMLPPDRKANAFAVSNVSAEEAPPVLRSLHAAARVSGNYRAVFDFLDSLRSGSDFAALYGSRWFMFSMKNLADVPASSGTVEFRSAPGSADDETARHWIAWVLSFVAKATSTDWRGGAGGASGRGVRGGTLADLRRFLLDGSDLLPGPCRGALQANRLRRVGGPPTLEHLTREEIERKKREKEERRARYGRP